MRKIVGVLCLLLISSPAFAHEGHSDLNVISRDEWGANYEYNHKEGTFWQNILAERAQNASRPVSEATLAWRKKKTEDIEEYLYGNFLYQFSSVDTKYYNFEKGGSYAWPLKYTDFIDSIIIHHTVSDYDDGIKGINSIHKYHSLTNQWGDIGYNYIMDHDGNIYEGREGGDYVVGAHSKYNNFGSIGIALIGNYNERQVSEKQKTELEKLIRNLVEKYNIDVSEKRYYHRDCAREKCDSFHLETYLDFKLAGHRDTGYTSCPGENLYKVMIDIRNDIIEDQKNEKESLNIILNEDEIQEYMRFIKILENYDSSKLRKLSKALNKINLDENLSANILRKVLILKEAVKDIQKT